MPWDWSAGGLVLRESGGRFDLLDGTMALDVHPSRNVVVGAPADGWDTLVAALRQAGFLA
jgi:myo-inositol-1(or 4)-monophosphatase